MLVLLQGFNFNYICLCFDATKFNRTEINPRFRTNWPTSATLSILGQQICWVEERNDCTFTVDIISVLDLRTISQGSRDHIQAKVLVKVKLLQICQMWCDSAFRSKLQIVCSTESHIKAFLCFVSMKDVLFNVDQRTLWLSDSVKIWYDDYANKPYHGKLMEPTHWSRIVFMIRQF